MGSRLSVDDSVRVVIVGGGFGGIAAASQLKSWAVPFVLVDVRDAFHHNVAALRASVESGFARKTFISYSITFGDSFRQGKVVGIDPERQQVLLSDGEELHYSHLILATGSDGPFPGKFNKVIDMESAIQTYEDMVKEVTLIHSKTALADVELLQSVRQEVKEILLRKGVRLLLSEKVSNVEKLTTNQFQKDMVVRTEKGTEVVADMVVLCTGIKINSSAYATAFGDKLASNGALNVNKHLQVEGYENIYAIGDCADLKEPKMAYHAGLHANIVVSNIINSLTHKPLKTYQPGSLTFLLSMGKNDGVGQVNGYYVGRLLVTIAKSRDLFVSKSWKTMGQTMPS
ncbi:apoptosis-inducing factor 2 isoform X2 [Numida meleagris]|uniref:apoptosis-inducing factor 2 isoform X2 n=1 Tax=Numida meleagris TaxID=8996 RepID=UPI000B3DF715|nr:apoptosis-inducing factor 2 isoform X2 [Numida meleagris]